MPPPTPRAAAVEADFRELLAENGLPEPDDVHYEPGEVVFLFGERKVAVIVDYAEDDGPNDPLRATRHRPGGPSPATHARDRSRATPPPSARGIT